MFCSFQCASFYLFSYVYFFVFYYCNAVINGIVLLISFWDCLLLVYKNTTDFCMLILYSITWLNLFIGNSSFCFVLGFFGVFLGSSMKWEAHHLCIEIVLLLFPSGRRYFSFLSNCFWYTMLNNSGESGHPSHVPDDRENLYIFHH